MRKFAAQCFAEIGDNRNLLRAVEIEFGKGARGEAWSVRLGL